MKATPPFDDEAKIVTLHLSDGSEPMIHEDSLEAILKADGQLVFVDVTFHASRTLVIRVLLNPAHIIYARKTFGRWGQS